jgi:hypothetical protein
MLQALMLFLANFIFIGLKAWQQRNVAFLKYGSVFVVSNLMAVVEVFVIFYVAKIGPSFHTILPIGIGGALGCLTAMYLTRGHNGDRH